jgi:hypothetical protein
VEAAAQWRSSNPDLLSKHGAAAGGEEDIAKVVKRARKQELVEGNVSLLRKAACATQSSEISSHLLSLSIDLSSLGLVGWLWPGGSFWRLPFGLVIGLGSHTQARVKKGSCPVVPKRLACLWGRRGEPASHGRGGVGGSAKPAAPLGA